MENKLKYLRGGVWGVFYLLEKRWRFPPLQRGVVQTQSTLNIVMYWLIPPHQPRCIPDFCPPRNYKTLGVSIASPQSNISGTVTYSLCEKSHSHALMLRSTDRTASALALLPTVPATCLQRAGKLFVPNSRPSLAQSTGQH